MGSGQILCMRMEKHSQTIFVAEEIIVLIVPDDLGPQIPPEDPVEGTTRQAEGPEGRVVPYESRQVNEQLFSLGKLRRWVLHGHSRTERISSNVRTRCGGL